jgi:sec-independent protein translocase protein TatB
MFGIGPQELVIIGLLILLVFGPGKVAGMARDLGRFVNGAQNTVDDFKSEILDSEEVKEARRSVGEVKSEITASVAEFKDETHHSVEKRKDEVDSSIEGEERDSDPPTEDETHQLKERGEPPPEEKVPPAATTTREQVEKEQQPNDSFDGFGFGGLVDTQKRNQKPTKARRPWDILWGKKKN